MINNSDLLDKKLNSIKRGSYWFGIVGRLSILFGILSFVSALFLFFLTTNFQGTVVNYADAYDAMISSSYVIFGWLFLLGRDAFESIEALIREMGEIV